MSRLPRLALVHVLFAFALTACSNLPSGADADTPDAGAHCEPGAERACDCAEGWHGRAVCLPSGTAYAACQCEAVPCSAEKGCASACGPHGILDEDLRACRCDAGYADGPQGPCTRCADGFTARDGACMARACGHGALQGDVCVCDSGWVDGTAGPCTRCADGLRREADACVEPDPCGVHGHLAPGTDACLCDQGWSDLGDARCSTCSPGFHASAASCVVDVVCGVHGTPTEQGTDCACEPGWADDSFLPERACSVCAPGFHEQAGACVANPDCGAHGWPSADRSECVCATGWADDGDEPCAVCGPGYHVDDGACVADVDCGGHGTPYDGGRACACDEGWTDALWDAPRHCTLCAGGHVAAGDACLPVLDCGAHGAVSADGQRCACDRGWSDSPARGPCSACAPGYHADGAGCVGDLACGPHGTSLPGGADCLCDEGYTDDEVHPTTAPCAHCAEGYHEDAGQCRPDPDCGPHGTLTADRRDCDCEHPFIDHALRGPCRAVQPFPGPCRVEHQDVWGSDDYVEDYEYDQYGRQVHFAHDGNVDDWDGFDDIIDGQAEFWRDTTYRRLTGPGTIEYKTSSRRRGGGTATTLEFYGDDGHLARVEWYEQYDPQSPNQRVAVRTIVRDAWGRPVRTNEDVQQLGERVWITTWTDTATTQERYTYMANTPEIWWRETMDLTGRRLRYETSEATTFEYTYDPYGRILQIDEYSCTHLQHQVTERFRYTYVDTPSGGLHVETERFWPGDGGCTPIYPTPYENWTEEYDAAGNRLATTRANGSRFAREADTYTYACWDWCSDGSQRDPVAGCPAPPEPCAAGTCGEHATCFPGYGVFHCECEAEYEGDPFAGCTKIPHGCTPNPCGAHASCAEQREQFTCTCEEGYEGDALAGCTKFDPCSADPCGDPSASCQPWSPTERVCVCPAGHYDVHGDGTECRAGEGYSRALPTDGGFSTHLVADDSGNVVMYGSFDGSLYWTEQPRTSQRHDAFAASFDAYGNLRWLLTLGGSGFDSFDAAAASPDGSVLLGGSFSGSVVLRGETLVASGPNDALLLRVAPQGEVTWHRRFASTGYDFVTALALDGDGGVFLGGAYDAPLTLGGVTLPVVGDRDVFLAHLAADGSTLWAQGRGGPQSDSVSALTWDGSGLVVSGQVDARTDLGGGVLPNSGRSLFLARYGADGTHLWSQAFSRAWGAYSGGGTLAVGANGDLLLSGWYSGRFAVGSAEFEPSSSTGSGSFVARFAPGGELVWFTPFDSEYNREVIGPVATGAGGIHVAGTFSDALHIGDQTIAGELHADIYVATLGPDGTLGAAETYGSPAYDDVSALTADASGALVAAGMVRGSLNLGWGPFAAGLGDMYLVRWPPPR